MGVQEFAHENNLQILTNILQVEPLENKQLSVTLKTFERKKGQNLNYKITLMESISLLK